MLTWFIKLNRMEVHSYRKSILPPSMAVAQAFGSDTEPILLPGGQGNSYVSGNIVLKREEDAGIANWMAEFFQSLPGSPGVRFLRPVKSIHGMWMYEGYVAWVYMRGEHVKGRYAEKLSASRAFHNLIRNVEKPHFLDVPRNSWAAADLVALGEKPFDYEEEFMELYRQIEPHLRPLEARSQLVHGDLSANILCDQELPPAIIDFSPAWAPNGFAEGIMLADAIAWDNPPVDELASFKKIPDIEQLAWRGTLRRIAEQAEHIRWYGKDKNQSVKQARVFQKAIDFLKDWSL